MIPVAARLRDSRRDRAAFQFSLRHLFLATLILSIYFAFVRSTGAFVATLVMGTYIVTVAITLMRIENPLLGGMIGTFLASALLVCAGLAFGPPTWSFIVGCFVYPVLGYTLGIVSVACRQ